MAYTDIDDPSAYFQTKLYTGTRANLNVTFDGNSDMSPNLVWVKDRTNTNNQIMFDSVRGINKAILPNAANAETTYTDSVTAFNSDGFTLGDDDEGQCNVDGNACASWNWKAGTSFTNDASSTGIGSIDSAGSVSTAAGFSIISYTGTGSAATVAHGLGSAPRMIIIKDRSNGRNWGVYHQSMGNLDAIYLDLTNEKGGNSSAFWNSTSPTSSVFSINTRNEVNASSANMIAYCFAEKKGYSKFGSYEGNGNADGTFVYLGFKPAWLMVKPIDAADNWVMFDNKRLGFNSSTSPFNFYANKNFAETTDTGQLDFVSNGFKIRNGGGTVNKTSTYIYMAFAENPFVTSIGVPATAR